MLKLIDRKCPQIEVLTQNFTTKILHQNNIQSLQIMKIGTMGWKKVKKGERKYICNAVQQEQSNYCLHLGNKIMFSRSEAQSIKCKSIWK